MEGKVNFGSATVSAEDAAGTTLMELTVHAWDLAVATGQSYELDPATARLAAAITAGAGDAGRDGGFFGPEVAVPETASEFEKALAVSGRDPTWSS